MDNYQLIVNLMDTCLGSFDAWVNEVEPGVFSASATVSAERGAPAYDCMGHGSGGSNFCVPVAAREMLQNGYDAGAANLGVGLVRLRGNTVMLFVLDDAPPESRLTLELFQNVFMRMDTSRKPGVSAGGKGQAKAYLASLSGLAMFGDDDFAAVVGVKYSAALSRSTELVTYRAATEAQRAEMRSRFAEAPRVTGGGLVVVRVDNCTAAVQSQLLYFLSLCKLPLGPLRVLDVMGGLQHSTLVLPALSPPLTDAKTLMLNTAPGKAVLKMTISNHDAVSPYAVPQDPDCVRVHVRCGGVLMFSTVATIGEVSNSDHLQLTVDISGEKDEFGGDLRNAQMFSLQRGDFNFTRLKFTVDKLVRLAAREFQGKLDKPCKFVRTAMTAGRPLLDGVSEALKRRLRIASSSSEARGSSAPDIQLTDENDRTSAGAKREHVSDPLKGCDAAMPVMVVDDNTGKLKKGETPVPSSHEVVLSQFNALIATMATGVYCNLKNLTRSVPHVGVLYTDKAGLLGVARSDTIYIGVIGVIAALNADVNKAHALQLQLNKLVETVVHETAHVLVDPEQDHSHTFWDAMVGILNNWAFKNLSTYLIKAMLPAGEQRRTLSTNAALQHMRDVLNGRAGGHAGSDEDAAGRQSPDSCAEELPSDPESEDEWKPYATRSSKKRRVMRKTAPRSVTPAKDSDAAAAAAEAEEEEEKAEAAAEADANQEHGGKDDPIVLD